MSLIQKLEPLKLVVLVQSLTQSKSHKYYTKLFGILSNSMTDPFGLRTALSRSFSVLVTRESYAEKIGFIFTDVFEEPVTVSMVITFLVGRVTHYNGLWTPDVAVNMADTAHSSQTKPGRLQIPASRSRRLQRTLTDVRNNKV
jgi:hypothetical protein